MTVNPYGTIAQLGESLRLKQYTSLELTRFFLDRLERYGQSLGAVVTITRERAEAEARKADQERAAGKVRGPLHGIPYGVKDLLATKSIPTTWGAEPYRNQVFDYDATVVKRLGEAGAILCAKLSMVELAGGFGYNEADASFTGPGRSPWNSGFWSGGSSSGPGAAVAAGLVPFAIGSETSGSILTPSAFCGVTGLRPTYGLVSRHGAMALCWTLDKVGPLARSAADCATVLQAISGHDPLDASSVQDGIQWSAPIPKRRRIALVKGTVEKVQPEVRKNFESTVAVFERLGYSTHEITMPDFPYGIVGTIVDAEGASAFEELLVSGDAKKLRCAADRIGGYEGAATLAIDYIRAMRIRTKIRTALLKLLTDDVEFILAPTRASVAYPIGVKFEDAYKGISGGPSLIGSMNLAGAPAIAFPNGYGENSLPTSAQIIAAPFRERELAGMAARYQTETDFHLRRPPQFQ